MRRIVPAVASLLVILQGAGAMGIVADDDPAAQVPYALRQAARTVGDPAVAAFAEAAVEAHAFAVAVAQDPSLHGIERALPPLLAAHAATAEVVAGAEPAVPLPRLGAAARALDAPDPEAALLAALEIQAPEAAQLPPLRTFRDLPDAIRALLDLHGVETSAEQEAELDRTGAWPVEVQESLGRLVAEHVRQVEIVRSAEESDVPGLLVAARNSMATTLLEELPVLRTAQAQERYLLCLVGTPGASIDIDLGTGDTRHDCDVAFSVDLAGDDEYVNNAGGAFFMSLPAAFALDLEGDDKYEGLYYLPAANGGSFGGAGFLWDEDGRDSYNRTIGIGGLNGGAGSGPGAGGSATLIDRGVDPDGYVANATFAAAINGGARSHGVGFLFDDGGDDLYVANATGGALNGGADTQAEGLLFDRHGNDRYSAVLTTGGGAEGAVNGGAANFARGMLLDVGGSDAYTGRIDRNGGVNGGSFVASGLLVDDAGANTYRADGGPNVGLNGASVGLRPAAVPVIGGVGMLLSGNGDDRFYSNGTAEGSSTLFGIGILLDRGGSNAYVSGAGGRAQGYGAHLGVGVLVDLGEAVNMTLAPDGAGQGSGAQGVGLVFRPHGVSRYLGPTTGTSDGAGAGLRLDLGTVVSDALVPNCGGRVLGTLDPSLPWLQLCWPDDVPRDVIDPRTGQPLGPRPKPPLCGTLQTQTCYSVEDMLLDDEQAGWLEAEEVTTTTSGSIQVVQLGSSTAQSDTRTVVEVPAVDESCRFSCRPVAS